MLRQITYKVLGTVCCAASILLSVNTLAYAGNIHKSGHVKGVTLSSRTDDVSFLVTFEDGDLTSYCQWDRVDITPTEIPSLEQRRACLTMAMTALTTNMRFDVVLDIQDPSAVDVACYVSPTTGQPCSILK